MRTPNVQQLLLTRFNIRSSGAGYTADQPADWLENRLRLFERFCAPSVNAQTQQDFEWIVFCDASTAEADLERIRATDQRVRTVLVAPATRPPELSAHHYVRPGVEAVLSTRLDNDDALSCHALRRVRDHLDHFLATGHARWVYNPLHGYKLDLLSSRLFASTHKSNPFLTLFEHVVADDPPVGAFAGSHGRMHVLYPSYQDTEERLWMQVIHGNNVSNSIRIRDVEVPWLDLRAEFGIQLERVE